MFVRIVKLSFHPEKINEFLNLFETHKNRIRNSKGCRLLELYRDKTNTDVFFTYSYWETEQDLEDYRKSEFFRGVWSAFKPLFNDKPFAWSVDKIDSLQ